MNHNYKFRDDVHYGTRHQRWGYYNSVELSLNKTGLPSSCDLSNNVVRIYDQGGIGACVSSAISSAISMKVRMRNNSKFFSFTNSDIQPSRLYNYNLSRLKEGERLNDDGGCMIETGLSVLDKYSFCDESLFDYNTSNLNEFPDLKASAGANINKGYYTFGYNKLSQNLDTIKSSLLDKNPVAMGIVLFDSIGKQVNGLIPTPDPAHETVVGGHAILLSGYDDNKQTFKFVNCWSEGWGNKGFGYIMYDYVLNSDIAGDIYNIV